MDYVTESHIPLQHLQTKAATQSWKYSGNGGEWRVELIA